jgi:uncharacterized OB-fold protein
VRPKVELQIAAGPVIGTVPPDANEAPGLIGSQCRDCGKMLFPPAAICPDCLSENIAPVALSRTGTLYSYTVMRVAARGWDAPYMLGYVDLPEGVRVFTHLTGMTPEDVRVDMPVSLQLMEPTENADGVKVNGFKFGPVGKAA